MSNSLVIVGAGGHAVSVANVAMSAGYNVIAFVDSEKQGQQLLGIPIIARDMCLKRYIDTNYAIAIGDNSVRERVSLEFIDFLPKIRFPFIVHSSAVVSYNTYIGMGTVIMPNATIGPNSRIGEFCIINTNASIDHDCSMADFSSVAPGVTAGGNVKIGKSSAVSIGAVIKHGTSISEDVVIGASSYVSKDIGSAIVCYGTPAKEVRWRKKGDAYLD